MASSNRQTLFLARIGIPETLARFTILLRQAPQSPRVKLLHTKIYHPCGFIIILRHAYIYIWRALVSPRRPHDLLPLSVLQKKKISLHDFTRHNQQMYYTTTTSGPEQMLPALCDVIYSTIIRVAGSRSLFVRRRLRRALESPCSRMVTGVPLFSLNLHLSLFLYYIVSSTMSTCTI